MTSPLEALVAFSKKELGPDQLWRALISHDDWLVPTLRMPGGEPKFAESVVMFSQEFSIPEELLFVFTDLASAELGAEKLGRETLGIYSGKVRGTALFGQLEKPELAKVKQLIVNAGSPNERTWVIKREGFGGLCRAWADAVACERAIADPKADFFATMRDYEGFWVPIANVDQTLVQVPIDGKGPHVFVFTAPDHYQRFAQSLGERGSQIKSAVIPGKKLFPFLLGTKIDGFLLNGSVPFSREMISAILAPPG